jgi:hypothetical protein
MTVYDGLTDVTYCWIQQQSNLKLSHSHKNVEKILVCLLNCVKGLRKVEYFNKIAAAAAAAIVVPEGHTTRRSNVKPK